MTVGELLELLQGYDEDAPVRVAIQPSWPLRCRVSNVIAAHELYADNEEEDEAQVDAEPDFVWIAVDQVGSSEHPYAPREAWS